MRKRLCAFIVMLALLVVTANIQPQVVLAKGEQGALSMTTKKSTLMAGKSFRYEVTYKKDKDKVVLSGKDVTWSVSDQKVATVKKDGTLKAKTVGKVTLKAKYRGLSVEYKVKVKGKKVIGIDAGHQAKGNSSLEPIGPGASKKKAKVASGTTGISSKVPEYKLTLEIAKMLEKELISRGYEVIMTRTKNDVNISNKERAQQMNKACDIGIRLHCDGAANTSVRGASVLYTSTKNPYVDSKISKKSKSLGEALIEKYCKATGIKNRGGYLRDDLTGCNWSTIPNVVLEMGFMSNSKEDVWMQKASNQKKMVQGIADGIEAYYK